MKGKKLPRKIIALICVGAFVAAILLTAFGFFIGFWVSDAKTSVWTPEYKSLTDGELEAIYKKEELADGDYAVLFEQTGLTKVGVDRARTERYGWDRVKQIHECYFKEWTVENDPFAPLICNDYLKEGDAQIGYLERGDIIISASTHFSGFRIGHAAIVTDSGGTVYQSNQVGVKNGYSTAKTMFANRTTFMVVRIKPEYFSESGTDDADYRYNLDRATSYIETQFKAVKYSIFTGVFTKKDSMQNTNCAHLIWYGFKHFDDGNGGKYNIDLDSNGRLLAMPKNIADSPYVELVQTFGFDPEKMYE